MVEAAVPLKGVLPTYRQLRHQPKEEKKPEAEEEALARMAGTVGWQTLKGYIEELISYLQSLQGAIDEKSTVEDVGFKFLAANIACFYLESVIGRVEGVKKFFEEEAEREEKKKQEAKKKGKR